MYWLDLWLLVPLVPAFAAGMWFIVRWKWPGVIPAVVLGLLAFAAEPYCRLYLQKYLDLIVSSTPPGADFALAASFGRHAGCVDVRLGRL